MVASFLGYFWSGTSKGASKFSTFASIDPLRHLPKNDDGTDNKVNDDDEDLMEVREARQEMLHKLRTEQQRNNAGQRLNSYASISMWKKYFHLEEMKEEEEASYVTAPQPIQTNYAKEQINLLHRTRFNTTTTEYQQPMMSTNNSLSLSSSSSPPYTTRTSILDNNNNTNSTNSNTNSNATAASSSSRDYQSRVQLHEQQVLHRPNLSVGPDSIYLAQ